MECSDCLDGTNFGQPGLIYIGNVAWRSVEVAELKLPNFVALVHGFYMFLCSFCAYTLCINAKIPGFSMIFCSCSLTCYTLHLEPSATGGLSEIFTIRCRTKISVEPRLAGPQFPTVWETDQIPESGMEDL